jgi:hypothetical protein
MRTERGRRAGALWRTSVTAAVCAAVLEFGASPALAADTSPPTQPGAITPSAITTTSATLTWGKSTDNVGIEGYRVYRGPATAADSALSLIATTDAVTTYKPSKLYSGTNYKFGVVAIDAANNKSPMRTVTFSTTASTDTTAPAAPSSASVAVKAFSQSRIDVVWAASSSSDVAGYQVIRDGTLVGTVDLPNGLRYSDNGLAAASSHSYVIKAVDSARTVSAPTTARTVSTLAAGTVRIARGPYVSVVTGTSAIVSWWTNIATPGVVSLGTASATERSVTDPAGSIQHHAVRITGLTPGTAYKYQVGNGAGVASAVATFRSAAAAGQTFSFAAIGDFGGGSPGASQNANNVAGAGTSFIQTVGDNIYPSAGLPDPNFTTTYSDFDTRFYKVFAGAIAGQAFFPANGNKEYYSDGEFWANFPMPGTNHSWYSYNWGDAHILVLDSEQPMDPASPQYAFAQSDLAANQKAAWRIVAIQRPPFSSSSTNASSVPVRQFLVPLFEQQKVQLVLSGNSHNYERSFPLINGVQSAGGVTYVVTGAGGNGFNAFGLAAPAWSAFREASYYEFMRVTVSPTALKLDAVRADTNAVFDSATITNGTPPPAGSLTLTPTDDATINQVNPVNAGAATRLTVDNSPVNDILLKFTVPSSCTTVSSAKLTLTVGSGTDNASAKGGDFFAAPDNGWSQGTVTWGSAPAKSGAAVASLGAVAVNTTYTVDVKPLVTGPGVVGIRVSSTSGDAAAYFSKEGSATLGPRLLLTC